MKIQLKRAEKAGRFLGTNARGNTILLDDGNGDGVSPMETVLVAVAGCSSIDIELILKKMKQDLQDIEVSVEGQRADDHPKVFKHLNVHYKLFGNIDPAKAERAVSLSIEKYCSVSKMIEQSAKIDYTVEIINPEA